MPDTNDREYSIDGRIERAKDAALGAHDSHPSHLDEAGEGVGGIAGALWGAEWGSAAGPLGALVGGIVGALGGWWAGRAVTEAASTLTHADDAHFRAHFDAIPNKTADRAYDGFARRRSRLDDAAHRATARQETDPPTHRDPSLRSG